MRFIYLLIVGCITLTSCKKNEVYPYQKEFIKYLTSELHYHESIDSQIFYLIPLNSCSPCVSRNLEFLSTLKNKNVIPVIIGQTNNSIYLELINTIKSQFQVLLDLNNIVKFYEIGLGKPLVIIFDAEEVIYANQIADYQVKELEQILEDKHLN